jgi:hypothetical protein
MDNEKLNLKTKVIYQKKEPLPILAQKSKKTTSHK